VDQLEAAYLRGQCLRGGHPQGEDAVTRHESSAFQGEVWLAEAIQDEPALCAHRGLEGVHRELARIAQQGASIGRHLVDAIDDRTAARLDRILPGEVDESTPPTGGGILGEGLADGFHAVHSEGNSFEHP
jgi:hypothetical protein